MVSWLDWSVWLNGILVKWYYKLYHLCRDIICYCVSTMKWLTVWCFLIRVLSKYGVNNRVGWAFHLVVFFSIFPRSHYCISYCREIPYIVWSHDSLQVKVRLDRAVSRGRLRREMRRWRPRWTAQVGAGAEANEFALRFSYMKHVHFTLLCTFINLCIFLPCA